MYDVFIQSVIGFRDDNIKNILDSMNYFKCYVSKSELGNARESFKKLLLYAFDNCKNDKIIYLQDDVIISNRFKDEIDKIDNNIIFATGYSNRKKDLELKNYYQNPSEFINAQCLIIEKNIIHNIFEYSETWYNNNTEHKTTFDLMLRGFLVKNKIKPYVICPSIVQHLDNDSLMNHKFGNRKSRSYV